MKHVSESLRQYFDHTIFRLIEEKSDTSDLKEKEKDGLAVIEKLKKNFDEFKKDANNQINKFKEFWEENQKTKEAFTETGDVYKMFNDSYVVGVLELPTETLSDGSIDGGMGAVDEPEEEIIEGKEIGGPEMNEAEEDDLGLDNLDDLFGDEEGEEMLEPPTEGDSLEEPTTEPEEPMDVPTDDDPAADMDLGSEPGEMDTEEPSLAEPQLYFVVYDITGDEREEIFRCGSNNVVKAFKEFYNDIFKGSMKDAILKYKEQKQEEKAKAEKSEKEKAQKQKDSKIKKFLGESQYNYSIADTIPRIDVNGIKKYMNIVLNEPRSTPFFIWMEPGQSFSTFSNSISHLFDEIIDSTCTPRDIYEIPEGSNVLVNELDNLSAECQNALLRQKHSGKINALVAIITGEDQHAIGSAFVNKSVNVRLIESRNIKSRKYLNEDMDDVELVPEDSEENDEMDDWYQEIYDYLISDFEFEEEDADNFMLIADEQLVELYNDDTSAFDAATIISDDEELLDELYGPYDPDEEGDYELKDEEIEDGNYEEQYGDTGYEEDEII